MNSSKAIKNPLKHLSASEITAFLVIFIGGLIAHLFIFTNIIPNFDGISRVYEEQQMTLAGRWSLHYATLANWCTQMPLVIGVLSNFFLALSGMLVVRMFSIRSRLLAGAWGLVYTVFPAIADTYAYTFTASAYCIAIFVAVLAVLLAKKGKWWGVAGGAALLAFAMGVYQAYAAIAIVLCVLLVIRQLASPEAEVKDILKTGVRYIVFLILGAVLYYGTLLVFLKVKDLEMWSYLGMSDINEGYPVHLLPQALKQSYVQVGQFFFGGANGLTSPLFLILNGLMAVVTVVLIAVTLRTGRLHKAPVKLIGFAALLVLLPLAANFVQVISPMSTPRLLMKFSLVYLYLLPVILLDPIAPKRKTCITLTLAGAMLASSLYFWQYDNLLYTMLDHAHRSTLSYATRMVSRVESCEGYEYGMPIVVIGGFPSDKYDTDIETFQVVRSESAFSSSVIPLNKHIYYYMNDWLNVPATEPADELCLALTATEEFKAMPLYPNDGSVQIIDGCVVVKVAEQYYPKSEFEKQYDNRR